ncbi:protein of unknown function [Taphrina deformans PYCC 5710]|uniref:WH2 domain-containing protein n=1 Tax=Taphrina deformans (strain PYCC 5710 / ATCC 11124 / CBS 356.35 / IMI 108563 / JCM 9778 / NBRC 8474) TaxID=1097556 RepID=R4XJ11_TAPDE|nr:protein of unknown function [Taphrina deformans PYCC 5710]|eukprot:CCG84474.1 protein of unknown function [Taphrina deformans PYCC 5710]
MPPPPPPPPPGPGPPGPPPPPNLGSSRGALPDRKGLLGDIAKGKQLKKAVTSEGELFLQKTSSNMTDDRSAPQVGGGVVASNQGPSSLGRPPIVPPINVTASVSSSQINNQPPSAPQLGGLFAGGMPTLRKTSKKNVNTGAEHEEFSTHNSSPGPGRLPPKAPSTRPNTIPETSTIARPIGIPPPPPAPPTLPTSIAPPAPPPPVPTAKSTSGARVPGPSTQVPSRPIPTERVVTQKPYEDVTAISAPRLPSLPTAPPPPLPSSASPAPPLPRSPAPLPVTTTQAPDITLMSRPAAAPSMATASPTIRTQATKPISEVSSLDGLQAALADRGSNRPSHGSFEHTSNADPSGRQIYENGFDSAAYSLKAQRVKRIDDSRYKFQPDSALPIIRPFTNCQKIYRSGRPQGSTVPLNLADLR